ncbi:WAS/WASL-interacting protein family member 2b [Chiloscyllium plagiosum]|uniref:WAS/WASL-interacting protein family member 2b n=1 Tax=Chiloscyllium plagiosum TaxID=36176 RepID=UPI001CB86C55|nr:WAS/WASL-interacting protein family member 2b [Chiloscyllium plagiosum]
MPIPPPPPPPPAAPPPPAFNQANTVTPKLTRDEQRNRGALLNDITKGAKLRKVTNVNDRSAPILETPKGGGGGGGGGGGFGAGPVSGGPVPSIGGLFQGGVPKLRPVGHRDSSDPAPSRTALNPPGSRSAAPRPPSSSNRYSDDSDAQSKTSPPELPRVHRPSLPDLSSTSRPSSASGVRHSASAPPPPPPVGRRSNPPPPPVHSSRTHSSGPYNREKPLPPTPGQRTPGNRDGPPAPPSAKPPPSPINPRLGNIQSQPLPPPPPPYRQPPHVHNGPSSPGNEAAPELPQRHNSLSRKSAGPMRGIAPPPPSPSPSQNRPPPPAREPPNRGAAPPPPPPGTRNGAREVPPPPPPYRTPSDPPNRGKPPPPPPMRTPAPPPPPPPIRNGHRDPVGLSSKPHTDDFESKYSFHPMEDFPAPEEYRHFQKTYPSKLNRVVRGAPPLPPVAR